MSLEKSVKESGGPFGAVIVSPKGKIIGIGQNKVTSTKNPTAHAEVQAIREACDYLNAFQLNDCVLYSSCEPCPMCLGAIYWARVKEVFYAADHKLAASGGFDDAFIYEEINKQHQQRSIPFYSLHIKERNLPFEEWEKLPDWIDY